MNRRITPTVISLSLSVLAIATAFMTVNVALAQDPALTPPAQPTATPTSLPCITQPELLSTYSEVLESSQAAIENVQSTTKEVLDSSQSAIENVRSTTQTVLWLVGAAFALLTLEGLGGLWLMQKATKEATKAMQEVEQARKQVHEVGQEVAQVKSAVGEIQNTYKGLKEQTKRIQEQIKATSAQVSNLGEDIDWYRRLMLLDQIRNDALRLFREEQIEWEDATNSLREQLRYKDPIAQLHIVRAFQAWAESDPRSAPELQSRIEQILESLIDSKPERLVRLEAERALKTLRSRGEEKQV